MRQHMPWNTPTIDDVLAEFTSAEAAALRAIQGTDKLADILTRAVNRARGAVLAGGGQVDQDGTIPDSLADAVIDLARWRWLISLPQLKALQTKERKDAHDGAVKLLGEVASRDFRVELPATPSDATVKTPSPSFGRRGVTIPPRNFTDETQDG